VPLHLRNPVTGLMRQVGYGKGYKYAHDYAEHFVAQEHLPDSLKGRKYYEPGGQGFEKEIAERLEKWRSRAAGDSGQVKPGGRRPRSAGSSTPADAGPADPGDKKRKADG
jgi:putative ATPase